MPPKEASTSNRSIGDRRARPPSRPRPLVLVVDDDANNRDVLSALLELKGYTVLEAEGGRSALSQCEEHSPDLVLLDVMMPDIDGYEVTRRLRDRADLPYTPIILVTARDSTQDKVMGLDAGADDYLTKPINFSEMEARVRSMLRIKRLQDELAQKNVQLAELSIRDGLTDLYNHRHLQALLKEEYVRIQRTGDPLAVVMFDLDCFKELNDTHGHPVGNRVLEQFASILRGTAREIDKLGRYGGEEFLVVLPESGKDAGMTFAERVRRRVEEEPLQLDGGECLQVTVSAGVAALPADRAATPAALVSFADQALYAAKDAGRNRVLGYQATLEQRSA